MADLQLAPARENSPLKAVIIAFVVLAVIAAAVALLNPTKTANLSVVAVKTFAPHTQYKSAPGSLHIIGQAEQSEDNLYVAATVKLEDKLRLPLFVSSFSGTMTAADGTTYQAASVSTHDLQRVGTIFPEIAPALTQPLADGAEAPPGGSVTGTVLLLFPGMNADAWAKKKSATLHIGLAHQDELTVALP